MEYKLPVRKLKSILLLWLVYLGLFSFSIAQQDKTVRGVVKDEIGDGIPGVSVLIKGTTIGTVTDLDGNFVLSAPSSAETILFSYLGFKKQELPILSSNMEVVLSQDLGNLDEVVVVGYGTQKRSEISGSVSVIDVDKATSIPTTNVAEMIRGRAAGVQVTLGSARPGGTSNILIRGRNSIRGGNAPLIVLDGFPVDNINDINPDDITSIEVLKDASSQAIYGARASNGVILVTTKRPTEGKVAVTIHSYLSTQNLTKNFDLYNAEEFAQLRREARRTMNPIIDGQQAYSDDIVNFGGSAEAPEYQNFIAGNYVNWEDEVLRTAVIQNHNISLSGGTDRTKVFSSINLFDQAGLIPTSSFTRGTFRINLQQKVTNKLTLETNLNMGRDSQRRETSNLDFITISPFTGPRDLEGNLVREVAGANASSATINPLWNIRESDNNIKSNFYNLNFVATYKFNDKFSYKLNALTSQRASEEGTYITRLHSAGVTPNGRATLANTSREEFLIENILNYSDQFNDDNVFDFTFVHSINERTNGRTFSTGTGFGSDILGFNGISNALNFNTQRTQQQFKLASFLGRARYTLKDKYLLTVTGRADGASVFAVNNKWGFFPAASFAWQMHKESFLANSNLIDELKLRASYGSVGNQSLDPYTTLGVVENYPYVFGGQITGGNLPGNLLPNPNLTWETSTTFNVGLDFGIIQNKLTGSIEYYNTETTDLLTDISLGGTSGFTTMITNGGRSKNNGVELFLTGHIINKRDFNWTMTAMAARNRNQILSSGIFDEAGNPRDDLNRNRFIGRPINVIRTLLFDGIFQSDEEALASAQGTLNGTVSPFQNVTTLTAGAIRLKDVNGDGVIDIDDNVILGTDPRWFGSVTSNVRYKNFELFADVYIVQGATRFNPYLASFNEGGTLQSVRNGIKVDYWTPENPSTTFPRPNFSSAPANISTMGIADASYVRLRTLTLSYNFNPILLNKFKMTNARLYFTGTNLLTFTDYKSYSPENNPGDFPDAKVYTLGVNLSF
ncbi:TonB-dependent receptor [Belliella sp. R4-6]|uniref:TonB-dependent receptor n=1 Tax=Belliella alkalica TaxID=1730871 RepID=A0ABS9V7D0_9BACT|nr:TonB-dependent receptor [Belliella alkalica]MCH7412119.1 TonB-dependent receptor [Belliella alkalica]